MGFSLNTSQREWVSRSRSAGPGGGTAYTVGQQKGSPQSVITCGSVTIAGQKLLGAVQANDTPATTAPTTIPPRLRLTSQDAL